MRLSIPLISNLKEKSFNCRNKKPAVIPLFLFIFGELELNFWRQSLDLLWRLIEYRWTELIRSNDDLVVLFFNILSDLVKLFYNSKL